MKTETMIKFYISLAEQNIGIYANFADTRTYCERYLREEEENLSVIISSTDIFFERESAAREDALEGKDPQVYSDGYLESLAIYRKICEKMVEF